MRRLVGAVVDEDYPLALGLDFVGACLYSAGLVLQRYSMACHSDDDTVRVIGCRMRRGPAWCLGLMTYGSGNGVYTIAMQFAPVSLLTTVFAVALVMNAILSKYIMGEAVDRPGAAGYVLILVGIGVSAVGLPKETAAFSADDMLRLAVQPGAVIYLASMLAIIASLSVFVYRFERDFPLRPATVVAVTGSPASVPRVPPRGGAEGIPGGKLFAAHIFFPIVLSSYETIAQLCIKGTSSMMLVSTTEHGNQMGEPIFFAVVALGVVTTLQAVLWLRKTYSRFDTTTTLPIEYACLTVSTNFGGIVWFQEHTQLSAQDWVLVLVGESVLLLGMVWVAVAKHRQRERELALESVASPAVASPADPDPQDPPELAPL